MRGRWNGGYIGPQQTPTAGSVRGIFNAAEMQQLSGASLWPQPANDPYFQYVTALLQGNGGPPTSASGTNTTNFNADASTNNFLLSLNGDVRNDEFHPYQAGYYSNFFDGTGDYLTISDNAAFEMTGDFTVEAWFYGTVWSAWSDVVTKGASGIYQPYYIAVNNGTLLFYSSSDGSSWNVANGVSLGAVNLNQWYHVAVSRQGTSMRLFLNGSLITTITNGSALFDNNLAVAIGGRSDGTELFTGYISNVRIVKGQGLYTAAFTPSTTPLTTTSQGAIAGNISLLTCQSNRIIGIGASVTRNGDVSVQYFQPFGQSAISSATFDDNQPSPGTNGYYGVYFDGTGDYLDVTNNAVLNLAGSSYTIECWLYPTTTGTERRFINKNDASTFGYLFYLDASNVVMYRTDNTNMTAGTLTAPTNNWTHVAVTNDGTTTRIFVNGVLSTSATGVTISNENVNLRIGARLYTAANPYTGYISNVRIVKGTALYTSNFTPSTTPLTAISNTSLLTCQSGSIIDNSGNNLTITTAGNATVTVSQPFTSTVAGSTVVTYGSAYFDGTGDWLEIPYNAAFDISTGNWTVECWWYPTTVANQTLVMINYVGGDGYAQARIAASSTAKFAILSASGATTWINTTEIGSYTTGQWYHLAYVRNGSTFSLYVNGVLAGSYSSASNLQSATGVSAVGRTSSSISAFNYASGYISNVRVVKGTAIYTASFIPPSVPATAVSNTQLLSLQYNGGASNSGFEDGGPFDYLITRNGNVSQGTFTPYGTNWSNYFDGSGDYLSFASNANYSFGTGDFTVECWVNFGTTATDRSLVSRYDPAGGWVLRYDSNGISFFNGDTSIIAKAFTPTVGVWYHIAIARQGTSMRLFINGVLENTVTNSTSLSSSTTLYIGRLSAGVAWEFQGWISNVRIVNGTAVYTSSFLLPTAPLTAISNTTLLTCQSNRFVDNSGNNATATRTGDVSIQRFSPFRPTVAYNTATNGGSAYFDGTTDWLNFAGVTVGTNPYTVEFWYYHTGTFAAVYGILGTANNNALNIRINNATTIAIDQQGVAQTTFTVPTMTAYAWNHVVAVRNASNVTTVFVNGVRSSTGTSTMTTNYSAASDYVGRIGTNYFPGFITDLRVVVGSAVYDPNQGTITVPTTPLTSVANTRLLLNMTNTGQYDNAMMANWESASGTQSNPSLYKYGTGSLYFDGNADYLTSPYTQGQWFLGNTFTIEAWVYIIARATSDFPIFSQEVAVTSSFAFQALTILANGTLYFSVRPTTGGGVTSVGGGTVSLATWTHCAVSVSAGQARVFLNGTQVGSTTAVTMMAANLPQFVGVAGYGNGYNTGVANSNHLNGYIDDLRVTRGIARYTANFTPPTAQFVTT